MNATLFMVIAATLVLIATSFVVMPLLRRRGSLAAGRSRSELNISVYRDQLSELQHDLDEGRLEQEQYQQARSELERLVYEEAGGPAPQTQAAPSESRRADIIAGIVASVAVPLLAGMLYLVMGTPAALSPRALNDPEARRTQEISSMIDQLTKRLANAPQDGAGWAMLARTQAMLGRFDEASLAFARSVAIVTDDAQLYADYADALGMARGRRMEGDPAKLIERALQIDPNNVKALLLAGTVAFDNRNYAAAIDDWTRAQQSIAPESEFGRVVSSNIDEAKKRAATIGAKP